MSKPNTDLKHTIARMKRDAALVMKHIEQESRTVLMEVGKESRKLVDKGLDELSTMLKTMADDLDAYNGKRKAKRPGTPSAPDQPKK